MQLSPMGEMGISGLGDYNPVFFAQVLLIWVWVKEAGMLNAPTPFAKVPCVRNEQQQ